MLPRSSRRAGFTLIELLAVIAIITILASLALGGIAIARKRARVAGTKVELERLARAVDQYHDDFGRYPPSGPFREIPTVANASPATTPEPVLQAFVDADLDGYADALYPASDSSSPRNAMYEENGIERLVLMLSTKSKSGPYFDVDDARLVNNDKDWTFPAAEPPYNSVFAKYNESVSQYVAPIYEWTDLFGRPLVYVRYDRYNPYNGDAEFADTHDNILLTTDSDEDGYNDMDAQRLSAAEHNLHRRVTPLDRRTGKPFRMDSYILYSLGVNGIDNLGYGDDQNGIDDDGNGVVDDEDDIAIYR